MLAEKGGAWACSFKPNLDIGNGELLRKALDPLVANPLLGWECLFIFQKAFTVFSGFLKLSKRHCFLLLTASILSMRAEGVCSSLGCTFPISSLAAAAGVSAFTPRAVECPLRSHSQRGNLQIHSTAGPGKDTPRLLEMLLNQTAVAFRER